MKVLIPLLLLVIGVTSATTVTNDGRGVADAAWLREPFYRWIPESMRGELRPTIERELRILRANMDDDGEPEYFAWVAIDHLNGLGILFDVRGGRYEPVYEIREPIYQVTLHSESRSLIIAAGHGGTGVQWNWFRVIQKAGGKWREVWQGIERSTIFVRPPFTERQGSVAITRDDARDTWVLRHATTYTLLGEKNQVLESHSRIDTYVFELGVARFITADNVPGAGRYLVLDRPETFGGSVLVLVAGLEQADIDAARVDLVDAGGRVVASGNRDGRDRFTLAPIDALKPGIYIVRLARPLGDREEVLDRVSLVVRPLSVNFWQRR